MYDIEFHNDVKKDLKKLGYSVSYLVLKKLKKIAKNPMFGEELGNKANLDLTGYKKVYVNNKKVRIVYRIVEEKILVYVISVGKRDDMDVYKKATKRIQKGILNGKKSLF